MNNLMSFVGGHVNKLYRVVPFTQLFVDKKPIIEKDGTVSIYSKNRELKLIINSKNKNIIDAILFNLQNKLLFSTQEVNDYIRAFEKQAIELPIERALLMDVPSIGEIYGWKKYRTNKGTMTVYFNHDDECVSMLLSH
ncbi:hypothetical protein L0B53_01245 [Vibrio sp. SS-MA-C1-2]|uniref:hypothetical protein n=1 Tax=Vibrio sp. SS-MA-C1-2 TaxID=2908646 RepID=UPI001F21AC8A|nr:hypothetical protein [Vibrio sp. SS-MA-C1-2]UJF17429.1 hypothetical protein L0B53_01245 [Vibrio sp. SS-MA-C1-2]